MLEPAFAESVVHAPAPFSARIRGLSGHVVLGLRLRPFTFWNAACLDIIESPLIGYAGELAQLDSLFWAIQACRVRYPHRPRLDKLTRYRVEWKIAREVSRQQPRDRPLALGNHLATQTLIFYQYMADYKSRPFYGEKEGSEQAKTPWYLYEVATLLHFDPRRSPAAAWNTEVGYGSWLNAARSEAAGRSIEIMTPEMREAFGKVGVKV